MNLKKNMLLPAAFCRASMKLPSRLMRRRAAVGTGCKESRVGTAVWTPPAGSAPWSAQPAAAPATLSFLPFLCCCYHSPQLGLNICKEGTGLTITPYFSDGIWFELVRNLYLVKSSISVFMFACNLAWFEPRLTGRLVSVGPDWAGGADR